MRSYKYSARDTLGELKEGLKQAVSPNDVVSWLREQGLTAVLIDEISMGVKRAGPTAHRGRIKSADLAGFCWQLTAMIEGGIPITTALETIAGDMENTRFQQILRDVLEKVERGKPFSDAISDFPNVFNRLFRAMVLAGESGGILPESLRRLAEYFDNRDKLVKKVKGAMAYPTFVFMFIILIVIFIMTFIIPRFRVVFDQIGGELPAFTQLFMGFYDAVRFNLAYIVAFFLLLIISGVLICSKTRAGHYLFSRITLGLPLLGKVFSQAFVAIFCRTMSTLLAAGVPVLEVLEILSSMTENDIIRSAIIRTREHIVDGSNISLSMAAAGFFPNMVVTMVQVGEESGSLTKVLDKTSDYYERKVDSTITTVMALLEPIMIVTVAGIVLVVVLALYLPIFSMSKIQ